MVGSAACLVLGRRSDSTAHELAVLNRPRSDSQSLSNRRQHGTSWPEDYSHDHRKQ